MELVLRQGNNELCISHDEDTVGFTVLLDGGGQLDFHVDLYEWKQLKYFIDNGIDEYKSALAAKKKLEESSNKP